MNTSLNRNHTSCAQESSSRGADDSVLGTADGLVRAIRRYELDGQSRRTEPLPTLTLLGDSEVEAFFGTIPTLTPAQFERLEMLMQIDGDRRVFEAEHADAIPLFREVA